MGLGKRIKDSRWLNRQVEALLATWLKLAHATSRWERMGYEGMEECLQNGEPIVIVTWHQRVAMAPYLFDSSLGPICTLTSASRAGRLAGNVVKRFGLGTISMSSHIRHIALTREVMRQIRNGVSVGMAADGPRGPPRIAKDTPLTWARGSGNRVFVVAYSARRTHQLSTWDEMWIPAWWTKGVFLCQEWNEPLERFSSDEETERLRESLEVALNAVTDQADRLTGRIS